MLNPNFHFTPDFSRVQRRSSHSASRLTARSGARRFPPSCGTGNKRFRGVRDNIFAPHSRCQQQQPPAAAAAAASPHPWSTWQRAWISYGWLLTTMRSPMTRWQITSPALPVWTRCQRP